MSVPRVICVMGIDGSGKTTVVEWLRKTLHSKGYRVDVHWLRFNHVFTRPLLGLCRLLGLTRYETVNNIRVGYHEFYRSKLISWLFIFLQYLDALRVRWMRIAPCLGQGNRVLILDRFVHDILIDLMVDTGVKELDKRMIGRALLRLLPEGTVILPLVREKNCLLSARPESNLDRNFDTRLRLYHQLIDRQGLNPLLNNGSLEEMFILVASRLGIRQ